MPMRTMLKSKIHRAKVTQADLEYEGSITLDATLLKLADILPNEEVHIWNVTRGTRFRTYAMLGEKNSGVVCVNGAAAHLASAGDLIIIASFFLITDGELIPTPKIVFVDSTNKPKKIGQSETPGPIFP
ncbi:MAG: aspartate 1-decarboxylase [Planctomycetaceae bacterium]|nr:aspartate 1-decarboxylase [Gemmataceae bacterium]PHX62810.1 MAG: aspartate 1-decarboxylase [Planctomycetaceae bacterium]